MRSVAFPLETLPGALPGADLLEDLLALDGVLAVEHLADRGVLRITYDEAATGPLQLRAAVAPLQPGFGASARTRALATA